MWLISIEALRVRGTEGAPWFVSDEEQNQEISMTIMGESDEGRRAWEWIEIDHSLASNLKLSQGSGSAAATSEVGNMNRAYRRGGGER